MRPFAAVGRAGPALAAVLALSGGCRHPTLVFWLETALCTGWADTLQGTFLDVDTEAEASFTIPVGAELGSWEGAMDVAFAADAVVRIRRGHECLLTVAAVASGTNQCVGVLSFPCRFVFAGERVGTVLLQPPGTCTQDGFCNPAAGEDCNSCRADCPVCMGFCGDTVCDLSEDCAFCPVDCAACPYVCGDGSCDFPEDCGACPMDCGACGLCGDSSCSICDGEDPSTCPADCGGCGDLFCDGSLGEDLTSCPQDCAACADGTCTREGRENALTCPADCTAAPGCGDGTCDPADPAGREDCGSCPSDCGPCLPYPFCGDGYCAVTPSFVESCQSCPADCNCGTCGDLVCDAGETCWNCPEDCSTCLQMCGDGTCETSYDCGGCLECPFATVG